MSRICGTEKTLATCLTLMSNCAQIHTGTLMSRVGVALLLRFDHVVGVRFQTRGNKFYINKELIILYVALDLQ